MAHKARKPERVVKVYRWQFMQYTGWRRLYVVVMAVPYLLYTLYWGLRNGAREWRRALKDGWKGIP